MLKRGSYFFFLGSLARVSLQTLPYLVFAIAQSQVGFAEEPSSTHLTIRLNGSVYVNDCSGAVVQFEGMKDSHLAWVVTNGHCSKADESKYHYGRVSIPAPGQVVVNAKIGSYESEYLEINDGKSKENYKKNRLVLATLTDMDLAIIELTDSYKKLKKMGIKVRKVSKKTPIIGHPISVISGYWDQVQSCKVDKIIPKIKEGPFTWSNAFRLSSECRLKDGYSGSIVVDDTNDEVIGLYNTLNENGEYCSLENPCEIWSDESQPVIHRDISYGPSLALIYSCLTKNGSELDLNKKGCKLPKPETASETAEKTVP